MLFVPLLVLPFNGHFSRWTWVSRFPLGSLFPTSAGRESQPKPTGFVSGLANMIELMHPSAHSSPQPIRQMDRFSRFCTAYGRKCLYFTMGAPIHQNCPFPCGIWTSHVTQCFRPIRVHSPNGTSISSTVFAQMTTECLYFTMLCLFSPQNCSFPCWNPDLI